MGCFSGPEIVNDGLVFYMDAYNSQRGWEGAPATNLFTETNLINWSKNAIVLLSKYTTPYDQPAYELTDNSDNSYLSISRNITVANDTSSYTIGVMVRKTYGTTSSRLGFNSGFNTGGTTVAYNQRFNSDTGASTSGSVIDLGDWWYWYFTITNNGTGNTNLYVNFYPATGFYNSTDNSAATGTAIIGEMMMVAGSTPIRFVNGTRSNTQAIIDLSGNNVVTATSLTYNANNTFTFDGSNNYIHFSKTRTNLGITNTYTLEAVFRRNTNENGRIIIGGQGWNWGLMTTTNGCRAEHFYSNDGGATNNYLASGDGIAPVGSWTHAVATFNHLGNMRTYINGVLTATADMSIYNNNWINTTICIGGWGFAGYRFNGLIPMAKVYNRELTAAEIYQNFEAIRGRYGI